MGALSLGEPLDEVAVISLGRPNLLLKKRQSVISGEQSKWQERATWRVAFNHHYTKTC